MSLKLQSPVKGLKSFQCPHNFQVFANFRITWEKTNLNITEILMPFLIQIMKWQCSIQEPAFPKFIHEDFLVLMSLSKLTFLDTTFTIVNHK